MRRSSACEVATELLVMGAYGHSPLRTFILGSTTTALMRACRVSVLLFR
jgi:nucleotide-binding universal stress UspA family protein